jgi:hypothetical protein
MPKHYLRTYRVKPLNADLNPDCRCFEASHRLLSTPLQCTKWHRSTAEWARVGGFFMELLTVIEGFSCKWTGDILQPRELTRSGLSKKTWHNTAGAFLVRRGARSRTSMALHLGERHEQHDSSHRHHRYFVIRRWRLVRPRTMVLVAFSRL